MVEFEMLLADMETKGEYEQMLRNLLAVLNRDGGHYAEENGLAKACIAAIDEYNKWRTI